MRVFTPGSTKNAAWPKYVSHIHSSVCCTGGTTFEIATPWRTDGWMPRVRSSVSKRIPYSSAVCSRRLVSRQDARSRSPSKTPILVLVLPTSATRSIGDPPPARSPRGALDRPRDDPPDASRVLHEQRPVGVEADREACDALDRDRLADRLGEGEPALAHGLEARAPRVELLEQRGQDRVAAGCLSRLERHRGGAAAQLERKPALGEVDPDADDEDGVARAAARLDEDAAELAPARQDVVRPFEPGLEAGGAAQRLGDGHRRGRRERRPQRERRARAD